MGILAAVSFVSVFAMKRNMTQTQADKNAELIFEAAQRQMVSFTAFDQDAVMSFTAKDGSNGLQTPVGLTGVNVLDYNMLAKNPDDTPSSLQTLLLEGQVSDDLYADGWVVEYDNTSLQVKAVFYFPEGSYHDFYDDVATNQSLRLDRLGRLTYLQNNGKVVGYFDGSTSSIKSNELKVRSVLKVENYEELTVKAGISVTGKEVTDQKYKIIVTTKGMTSDAKVTQVFTLKGTELQPNVLTKNRTAQVAITLDSLTGNNDENQKKRFKKTYGSLTTNDGDFLTSSDFVKLDVISSETNWVAIDPANTFTTVNFIPGEDLEIEVKTQTENGSVKDEHEVKEQVNSLYASFEADKGSYVAKVKYGRHLQNLDEKSGINLTSFAVAAHPVSYNDMNAIQAKDIYFDRDENKEGEEQRVTEEWWKAVYGNKKFLPITNEKLTDFSVASHVVSKNGKDEEEYYIIHGPIFDTTKKSYAGLFAEFRGDNIDHVTLINSQFTGSSKTQNNGAIGGLVGKVAKRANANVSNTVTIDACRLYMDEDMAKKGMAFAKQNWMNKATNIGGLVGYSNRSLEIKNSSASTVMTEATYAGGLVGVCEKNVKLEKSYADSYIGAKNIGGLIASCTTTDALPTEIDTCYAAGFVTDFEQTYAGTEAGNVAGIAPVEVKKIKDVYSVFSFGEKDNYKKADNTYGAVNFYPTVKPTFDTTGNNVTDFTYVYYLATNFDVPRVNKVGVDRSSKNMKLSTATGFSGGAFAYIADHDYERVSMPYKLVAQTPELVKYQYPMIALGDKKTLDHYGDWQDSIRVLNVRFLYSEEALQQYADGDLTLPKAPAQLNKTADGFTKFEEDTLAPAEQKIQEYSNAFIPNQNYELSGRERAILYWQFTYNGEDYFYVPSSEDNYNPTDGGKKYKGTVYRAMDCEQNIIDKKKPWDNVLGVDMTNMDFPLESVTLHMDVKARFYIAEMPQYIRLNYRIFEDSSRTLSTALKRYIGKADIKKNVVEENGVVVSTTYTAEADAHANIGGYHFFGWATTETGKKTDGSSSMLQSSVATETSQKLMLSMENIESGDLYAIYERIGYYPVNVEFCLYDGNNEGWGANIAQPRYNIYSTEDWVGDKPDDRKIMLPKSSDVSGYVLYKDPSWTTYKALFFDASGRRNSSRDIEIKYDGTSLADALTAGTAYVNIDITKGGTYVVPYVGEHAVNYRVNKVYMDMADNGAYSVGAHRTVRGTVNPNGMKGSNIPNNELLPEDDGFVLDHFGINETPLISPTLADGATYVCTAYYKRKSYELFYDLNGGTYLDGTTKKGYHEDEVMAYGQPLGEAPFVTATTANPPTTALTLNGSTFAGWKYYRYADRNSEHTSGTMPKERIVAVAQWAVSDSTSVRLEIYRQDRTNALSGTTYDTLANANANKTYLLEKSTDITDLVPGVAGRNAILNVADHNALVNLMNGYSAGVATKNGGKDLLMGYETRNYFTPADTTSADSKIPWATVKPALDSSGTIVVRVYYDRQIITATLNYSGRNTNGYYAWPSNFYDDRNDNFDAYKEACRDIRSAEGKTQISVSKSEDNATYDDGGPKKYITSATVTMKALYGAPFVSPYVWTDEIRFAYDSYNTSKRQIESFIDESGAFGSKMSSPTNWEFRYYGYNENNACKVYLEDIGYTGTTYAKTNFNLKYEYKVPNSVNNIFEPGTYHGYQLYAMAKDGSDLDPNVEEGDPGYSMAVANEFYFIRKTGYKLQYENTNVADTTDLKYKQVVNLPATATRDSDTGKYNFMGWYATSDFSGDPITSVTMDDHDAKVYAKWEPIDVTITYNPAYPDAATASGTFVNSQTGKFGEAAGELKKLVASDAGVVNINGTDQPKIYEEAGDVLYRFIDGEGHLNTYRFDGWWRTDTSGNYTVQMTGNEVLYDNATVKAKWTQTKGYATLHIHCVQVDHTESTAWHNEDSASKIELGTDVYVMAPLVTSGWGGSWAGYFPTQTRIKEKFYGENPEVTFYYSQGTLLSYKVTYNVTFNPYTGTTGTAETIAVKEQEYSVTGDSASVVSPDITGYNLTSANPTVTVVKTANNTANPEGVVFAYEPDLRNITMSTKVVTGTGGTEESFPMIEMPKLEALFQTYPSTTAEYELAPMYQIYNADGASVTNNSYVNYDQMKSYIATLPSGTYRVSGQVRLKKNGSDVLTIWQSPSNLNFTLSE